MFLKPIFLAILSLQTFFAAHLPSPSSSAGVVEREVVREFEARPLLPYREVPLIELDTPEELLDLPEGKTTVSVQKVCFQGQTIFSSEELEAIVASVLCNPLCMSDIRSICQAVQEFYILNGYFLARVFPPPQRIDCGVLTLEILEGTLGNITIEGNCYYPKSFILGYLSHLCNGPIHYDSLMKALFLLNENIELYARAVLAKGEEVGTADLVVQVEDHYPVHLYLNTNNFGTKATSRWRSGARLDFGNFITPGDTLSIAGVFGYPFNALRFANAIYTLPINRCGGYLSAGYLYSDSVVDEFLELNLKGRSEIASIEFRQALQRKVAWSTDGYIAFEYKQIHNFALGRSNAFDRLRVLSVGLDFDIVDRFCGRNAGDIWASCGIPRFLGGSRAEDPHASRKGSGGRFFFS